MRRRHRPCRARRQSTRPAGTPTRGPAQAEAQRGPTGPASSGGSRCAPLCGTTALAKAKCPSGRPIRGSRTWPRPFGSRPEAVVLLPWLRRSPAKLGQAPFGGSQTWPKANEVVALPGGPAPLGLAQSVKFKRYLVYCIIFIKYYKHIIPYITLIKFYDLLNIINVIVEQFELFIFKISFKLN